MSETKQAGEPRIILKPPSGYLIEKLHTYADNLTVDKEYLEEAELKPISTLRVVQFLLSQLGEVSTVHAASVFIDDVQSTRKFDYERANELGECADHIWWDKEYAPVDQVIS